MLFLVVHAGVGELTGDDKKSVKMTGSPAGEREK